MLGDICFDSISSIITVYLRVNEFLLPHSVEVYLGDQMRDVGFDLHNIYYSP